VDSKTTESRTLSSAVKERFMIVGCAFGRDLGRVSGYGREGDEDHPSSRAIQCFIRHWIIFLHLARWTERPVLEMRAGSRRTECVVR